MKKYLIANWKMNMPPHVAQVSAEKIDAAVENFPNIAMTLCPTATMLVSISERVKNISLGAQNFYPAESGNFTGEVSVSEIKDHVKFVIIGHSERRQHFHEDDAFIHKKAEVALQNSITPILCVGESAEERRFGKTTRVLYEQLEKDLPRILHPEQEILIAYEPVWAISGNATSRVAEPEEVAEALKHIDHFLHERYGKAATQFHIIYGGSVDAKNAPSIFSLPGCTGALVGKASLDSQEFLKIAEILNKE